MDFLFKWCFLIAIIFCSKVNGVHKFIVYSPPKCGTHLIGKTLQILLDKTPNYQLTELGSSEQAIDLTENITKNNGFVVAHNWSTKMLAELAKRNYRFIFIIRDPRDQILSMQNWMQEGQWGWLKVANMVNQEKQLKELISGSKYGWRCYDGCIGSRLACLKAAVSKKKRYISKFENLVGLAGNGSNEAQIQEIMNLANFLDFQITASEAEKVSESIFGGTFTFRVGKAGQWKTKFKASHLKLFNSLYKKTLLELGYN